MGLSDPIHHQVLTIEKCHQGAGKALAEKRFVAYNLKQANHLKILAWLSARPGLDSIDGPHQVLIRVRVTEADVALAELAEAGSVQAGNTGVGQ